MSPGPRTQLGPTGVVVGIGDQGFDTVRAAVRPAWSFASSEAGAWSMGLHVSSLTTPLGQSIQIRAESSPQTGIDLLLAHSRTAAMLVLQRVDGWMPAGPTTSAVMGAARRPT